MNAITGLAAGADLASDVPPPPVLHTLRRTGCKAVRFTGWQMLQAQGAGDVGTMWYDLSIYRSVADAIIVELVARREKIGEGDLSRVEVFASLQEAASWLEDYPCAADVPIPPELASGERPMAQAVLQAVQLRQRLARITDEYQGLLSDVFGALDITAPACDDGSYRKDTKSASADADLDAGGLWRIGRVRAGEHVFVEPLDLGCMHRPTWQAPGRTAAGHAGHGARGRAL